MNKPLLSRFDRLAGAAAALHGLFAVIALAASAHIATSAEAADLLMRGGQIELFHALAIFAALCVGTRLPAIFFAIGATAFALPLYLHGLAGFTALGFLAPIGGVSLIAGWVLLLCNLLLPQLRTA